MQNSQGSLTRPDQAEFQGGDTILEGRNLTSRGLSLLELQQRNAPEKGMLLPRNSERLDPAGAPVNFDVFGSHQQVMRNQHSGMPQALQQQQSGMTNMQVWQQQLMYKQFQELQRQHQSQQLDQELRQQNSLTQQSSVARHAAGEQFPGFVNGIETVHDTSTSMWPTDLTQNDAKVSNPFGTNMNWVQRTGGSASIQGCGNGLMFSQNQNQVLHAVGFVSQQQFDESLYGAPVASARAGVLSHLPHLQGIAQDGSHMLNRQYGNLMDKRIIQSSGFNSFENVQSSLHSDQICMLENTLLAKQGFQAKNFSSQIPVQTSSNGVTTSNDFEQINPQSRNISRREFQEGQDRSGCVGNLEEKPVAQVGTSQVNVSLDPTEERILFNSDDGIWGAFGRSGGLGASDFVQGNQLDGAAYFNAFPSVQSGTWSALMQSAVAEASSSDACVQDEWSGLSFQKVDMSTGNQPSVADNCIQNSSSLTSKPFSSFEDSTTGPRGFEQSSTKFVYGQTDRVRTDTSQESLKGSAQEGRWLNQRAEKKPSEGLFHGQTSMCFEKASEGAWRSQMYKHASNVAQDANMALNMQNVQGSLTLQQNRPVIGTDASRPHVWNVNEAMSLGGNSQGSDHKRPLHVDGDPDSSAWKSNDNVSSMPFPNVTNSIVQKPGAGSPQGHAGNLLPGSINATISGNAMFVQGMNQKFQNVHQANFEKNIIDSSLQYRVNEHLVKYQNQALRSSQLQEFSSVNYDRELCEGDRKQDIHVQKEILVDSYGTSRSQTSQQTFNVSGSEEKTWLNASASNHLSHGNRISSGQVGLEMPVHHKFQYHPMGNEVFESAERSRKFSNSQGLLQRGFWGEEIQGQGYNGQSELGQTILNIGRESEKGNIKAVEELDCKGVHFGYNNNAPCTYEGSAGIHMGNQMAVQTSQNMLELLHKVDQFRDAAATQCGSVDNASERPESSGSDASASRMHSNQSAASQGCGLRLGLPSQRQPIPNTQIVQDVNSRQTDANVGQRGQTFLSATCAQRLCDLSDLPQQEHWGSSNNMRPSISPQSGNEACESAVQGGCSSSLPRFRNQQHHLSGDRGQVLVERSPGLSYGNESNYNLQNSYVGASAQSAHGSLYGPATGVSPSGLPSEPYLSEARRAQILNANSFQRSSGQQESSPGSQQNGPFSKMLHNVWTSVPTQQHIGPQHKVLTDHFQLMNPSSSSLGKGPWAAQKADYQNVKRGGNDCLDLSTCIVNSEQLILKKKQQVDADNTVQPSRSDLVPQTPASQLWQDASVSTSEVVNPPQQEPPQIVSHQASSNVDMEAFGRSLRPLNFPLQSYSLLRQMQAMRNAKADSNRQSGKRLRGADSGSDNQQMVGKTSQQVFYGYGSVIADSINNDSSYNGKMLCFSSDVKEDQSAYPAEQHSVGDTSSKNCPSHHAVSASVLEGIGNPVPVNPQMAPSWFEQYGSHKKMQMLGIYDRLDSSGRNAKIAAQQFFFGEGPESLRPTSYSAGSELGCAPSGSLVANKQLPSGLAVDVVDRTVAIVRPKKRKTATSELLPWHKEVTEGLHRLHTVSEAELDWVQVTCRHPEKLEDEAVIFYDIPTMPQTRRRLLLTTQLMQQLLCSMPAAILSANATSEYEAVTFFAARLGLGNVCSIISCSGSDSGVNGNDGHMASEKYEASVSVSKRFLSKVVEDFIGRARKLESDLSRFDRRSSILDLRVECHDLERFSVINRFAKYLARGYTDGSESSSTEVRRPSPQRYVTATAMATPRSLPEGVFCLSL